MQKFIADANIGLRILVGDKDIAAAETSEQAERIRQIVERSHRIARMVDEGKASILFQDAVVVEMVYVLSKYYELPREEISEKILLLLEAENVESSLLIRETLRLFSTVNLDLIDIKLGLLSKELNIPILTWDKGFSKLDCESYSPSEFIDNDNK